MDTAESFLKNLPANHRMALEWFINHTGTDQPWPQPIEEKIWLATKAKGIYKPNWTKYALSVRQTLNSPYADKEPIIHSDGTWSYLYFQEGKVSTNQDNLFTNRALMACWEDNVPVGVMRQISGKPQQVKYLILGIALITGWEDGYFFLEGFSPEGKTHGAGTRAEIETIKADIPIDNFDPASIIDGRKRIIKSIIQRQGQGKFRQELIETYGCCAISGCPVIDVLEAAHIIPYKGIYTNVISNGLPLRADIHTLFDLGLISIDPQSMTVLVSPKLDNTPYSDFKGKPIYLPSDGNIGPSKEALQEHRKWANL
jgi:hypothetical protein